MSFLQLSEPQTCWHLNIACELLMNMTLKVWQLYKKK